MDTGGEHEELMPIGTDELMDVDTDADLDLGGDENGGDDDLEGM